MPRLPLGAPKRVSDVSQCGAELSPVLRLTRGDGELLLLLLLLLLDGLSPPAGSARPPPPGGGLCLAGPVSPETLQDVSDDDLTCLLTCSLRGVEGDSAGESEVHAGER